MKKFIIAGTIAITLLLTLGGFMTAGAQNADNKGFAGEWLATYTTPVGAMNCNYTFKVEGNVVTGKVAVEMSGTKSESEIKDGKIEGDKITFTWIYNNDVPMSCTGILAGDEIKLTRQAGTYGTESAVAKRVSGSK
jgi:hypothetical protein